MRHDDFVDAFSYSIQAMYFQKQNMIEEIASLTTALFDFKWYQFIQKWNTIKKLRTLVRKYKRLSRLK